MDTELKYVQSLLSKLNSLQKDSILCDVEVTVCDEIFHAHRVMLSAASPYFQVMFCGGMLETFRRKVELQGLSSKTFAVLLDFMYSGKISIASYNVQELLAAAKMLQLDHVVESCCQFLTKELTPSNCLGIFLFSDLHSCKNLYKTVLNFIQRNFNEVSQDEEFLQIDQLTLLMFIKSDEITVTKEEDVFVAVIRWILHDVENRCQFIRQLFEHVKLPLLSSWCVKYHLKKCEDTSVKKMMYTSYEELLQDQQLPQNTMFRCPRTDSQKCFYVIGGSTRKPDARWSETVSLADVEQCSERVYNNSQKVSTSAMSICPMNHPRNSLGVATVNGLIYAIGGENDSLIYDSVECYDPVLSEWRLMAPMLAPRVGLGACEVKNKLYVVGGWIGSEIAKTMEKYDPYFNSWRVVGDVPTPRYHAGVCEMNGLIYIVGGMDDCGEDLRTGDCYYSCLRSWSSIAPMQHKRSCVTVVGLDGCIYAIGGCNGYEGALASVEKFDVRNNRWEDVEPLPCARVSACATYSGSCIYVFGGKTLDYPPEILDNIDCYDTRSNEWFSAGKLQLKRSEAGVVII